MNGFLLRSFPSTDRKPHFVFFDFSLCSSQHAEEKKCVGLFLLNNEIWSIRPEGWIKFNRMHQMNFILSFVGKCVNFQPSKIKLNQILMRNVFRFFFFGSFNLYLRPSKCPTRKLKNENRKKSNQNRIHTERSFRI